jgi:hypothetical protein
VAEITWQDFGLPEPVAQIVKQHGTQQIRIKMADNDTEPGRLIFDTQLLRNQEVDDVLIEAGFEIEEVRSHKFTQLIFSKKFWTKNGLRVGTFVFRVPQYSLKAQARLTRLGSLLRPETDSPPHLSLPRFSHLGAE